MNAYLVQFKGGYGMTVGRLIEILSKVDPSYRVNTHAECGCCYLDYIEVVVCHPDKFIEIGSVKEKTNYNKVKGVEVYHD